MVHPSAYIDPKARLGRDVRVGPNSYVGAGVVLGDGCVLHNNVTIDGLTAVGRNNEFFPCTVIGVVPQDLKYKGTPTRLEIGDENVFREHVTVHAGTEVGGGVTRIGSRNRLLVGVHIAHDVTIGDECIVTNYVQLAGHCRLENRVTVGGLSAMHHFVTVGTLAYIGGMTRIVADVPPYMIVEGNPSRIRGFNRKGMERWGWSQEQIRGIREAYRILYGSQDQDSPAVMLQRLAALEARTDLNGEVLYLCRFLRRHLDEAVRGRILESQRRDTDADREAFYRGAAESKS